MNMQSFRCKLIVIVTYGTPFIFGLLVFLLCFYLDEFLAINIADFYHKNMRSSLFAGFLTLGSFLLSLKTGIVIKIKENVFDKPGYQKKVDEAQAAGLQVTVYEPLKRLSKLLSAAVLSALIASMLQMTLGLFQVWWATAVCLSVAVLALIYLLEAFALIQINLLHWFDFLDEEAEKARVDRKTVNLK